MTMDVWDLPNPAKLDADRVFAIIIDGGGSAITTGVKGDSPRFPFAGIIKDVTLVSNEAGSIVIDIWKSNFASFPPTVANSIAGAALPTLASAQTYFDNELAGWTTRFEIGDILRFNVNSVTTCTRVTLTLTLGARR